GRRSPPLTETSEALHAPFPDPPGGRYEERSTSTSIASSLIVGADGFGAAPRAGRGLAVLGRVAMPRWVGTLAVGPRARTNSSPIGREPGGAADGVRGQSVK